MELFVALAALLTLLVAYVAARRRLLLRESADEVLQVPTADGWRVCLRHYRPRAEPRFVEPVILCHGLGANHYNVDLDERYGLAQQLAARGRDCWVISLRGHRGSDHPTRRNGLRWGFSFDDYRAFDVPAAIAEVLARTGAPRAQWVAHSMGGMLALSLGGTALEEKLAGGIVAIGSPSSFADQPYLQRLARLGVKAAGSTRIAARWLSRLLAPFTGFVEPPFSELAVAPRSIDGRVLRRLYANAFEDLSAGVLQQFDDWVNGDHFRSLDRSVDYQDCMRALKVPVLLVGGNKDMLAPPRCMEKGLSRIGSADKSLLMFGTSYGSAHDYGHGDLIFGRSAPEEILPRVVEWLEHRATPLPPKPAGTQ
ncbi:MAG: alpha/beta fold hydrolase [Myxococcales bacterium]